jgi:hypothetical protein
MPTSSRCPRCDRTLVEITITLEGDDVTMLSCSACDHRQWRREGEPVDLDGVLTDLGVDRAGPGHD